MKSNKMFLWPLLLFITACGPFTSYTKNEAIPEASWDIEHSTRFEFIASDTTALHNIFINLRHTGIYKYNNIYLFVTTLAPNGQSVTDTAAFVLADARGKWYGRGIGDIYDVNLAFKRNVQFAQSGKYIFIVKHGMRDKQLKEITDVGIQIDISEK